MPKLSTEKTLIVGEARAGLEIGTDEVHVVSVHDGVTRKVIFTPDEADNLAVGLIRAAQIARELGRARVEQPNLPGLAFPPRKAGG